MDGKRRPGDIGGPPTDEIGNGRADITFGIAQGPQGDASDQTLLQPRVVLQRCLNRRRARERDDGVHPDAVFGPHTTAAARLRLSMAALVAAYAR